MSLHLFRPAEADSLPSPPGNDKKGQLLAVAISRVLAVAGVLATSARVRRTVHTFLICLALVVQAVLILTVAYLCDLCISLMELWAELARKHLEITLSP